MSRLPTRASLIQCWPLFLIFVVWLIVFWRVNTGQTVVGFRDSGYLYYPYFQWIDEQWAAGDIPLWNPYCGLGHPVVGDGTSSVFYPGKLVFWLRFLSYPSRYGIYLSMHVLWAAIGTWCFVRKLGGGPLGAGLGAFSYAFGGSVLFQTTNVVFLVSAAWLPFALLLVWQMLKRNHIASAVIAAVPVAMMVLGGDPQMAYMVLLVAIGLATSTMFLRRKSRRLYGKPSLGAKLSRWRYAMFAGRQVMVFGMVAFCLSAIQILPTYVWSQNSTRDDAACKNWSEVYEPLVAGSAREATYQFSQPPWSLAELFVSDFSGKPFPIHQRWTRGIPSDDRFWTPSLYVGLIAILFALSGIRLWGRQRKLVWLSCLAIFFGLASFGWYGPVWLVNELRLGLGQQSLDGIANPVGGVYWAMTVLVPKFYLFRYPAKLFAICSLAVCVLAGLTFGKKKPVGNFPFVAPLLIGLFATVGVAGDVISLPTVNADAFFGPFDEQGAIRSLRYSLLQSLAIAVTVFMFAIAIRTTKRGSGLAFLLLFVVAIVDVATSNYWLLAQVPAQTFEEKLEAEEHLAIRKASKLAAGRPVSFVRNNALPKNWAAEQSASRLEEVVRWRRESLHPKCNLGTGCRVASSFSSIENRSNMRFTSLHASWLNKRLVSDPTGLRWTHMLKVHEADQYETRKLNSQVANRAWVLPGAVDVESIDREWKAYWDFGFSEPNNHCKELDWSNNTLALDVVVDQESILVFNSLPVSGWRIEMTNVESGELVTDCQIDGSDFFVLARVNPGRWIVELVYDPVELKVGAGISVVAWMLLTLGVICAVAVRAKRSANDR